MYRPNRQHRRRFGKHDTADAEAAARALQADAATGEPKSAEGPAEMVRTLHVARRSALKARTQAANQLLRSLLVTAPEELKAQLRGLSTAKLVATAARFRPGDPKDLRAAPKLAMRFVARRHRRLSEERSLSWTNRSRGWWCLRLYLPLPRCRAWAPTRRARWWSPP